MTRPTSAASPISSVAEAALGHTAAARPPLSGEAVLLGGLVVYAIAFTILPLGALLAEGFASGKDGTALGLLREAWASRAVGRALGNTLVIGLSASALSVILGAGMALVLRLTDIRLKPLLSFLFLMPMLVPPQITALAWIGLFGPASPVLGVLGLAPPPGSTNPLYSTPGIIFVMGVEHSALVFLSTVAGLRAIPRDLVEAARLAGARPMLATIRVVLPLALPGILAGGALAFVSAIGNFGVPALLGIPGRVTVLTTLIYQRLNGFGPSVLGEVAAIALILVALAAIGLAVRAVLVTRGAVRVDRTGAALDPFPLGRLRLPTEIAASAAILCIAVLPFVALAIGSLVPALGAPLTAATATLDHYRFALGADATRRAFVNSILLAGSAALVSAAIAVPFAYLAVLRRSRPARALGIIADAPYAVPGTVLALGVIIVFLPPLPILGISIYGTFAIILVAYLARFLPLVLRPVEAALETLDPALDEAARVSGVRIGRRLTSIIWPVAAPAAAAGGLLAFMSAFNELTVSALLWSTGVETLGVTVFFLQYEGNSPAAAALATVTVLLTLAIAFVADRIGRRFSLAVVPWRG